MFIHTVQEHLLCTVCYCSAVREGMARQPCMYCIYYTRKGCVVGCITNTTPESVVCVINIPLPCPNR